MEGISGTPVTDRNELLEHLDNNRVTWINIEVSATSDVRFLRETIQPPSACSRAVLDTGQRPKVEHYDDYLFIVAEMLYLEKEQMCGEQVSMFLGKVSSSPFRKRPTSTFSNRCAHASAP
jgi:magnesium transporter